MEVRAGYKQTEIGVIPDDWETYKVSQFTLAHKQGFYTKNPYVPEGVKLARITDLHFNKINFDDMPSLKISEDDFKQYKISEGDFLFARSGAIGRYGIVSEPVKAIFGSYIIRFVFNAKLISNYFFGYAYQAEFTNKQLLSITQGSSNININAENIKALKIPIPKSKIEQDAIAEALIDADTLIESLEKLIEKKLQIKQGAMQELLTGKKRLPGFIGEWNQKTVSQLGEVVTGGTPSTQIKDYWGGEHPWVTPTDITSNRDMYSSERLITEGGLKAIRRLPPDTVLVTCIASIGKNAILKTIGACNQQINALIPNSANKATYLYYLFELNKQYFLSKAGITATLIISKNIFQEMTFVLPEVDEQEKIAEILIDMDSEISELESKLTKARQIKQGMMQELLTGRIRLV